MMGQYYRRNMTNRICSNGKHCMWFAVLYPFERITN